MIAVLIKMRLFVKQKFILDQVMPGVQADSVSVPVSQESNQGLKFHWYYSIYDSLSQEKLLA